MPPPGARQPPIIAGHCSNLGQVSANERALLRDRALPASLGSWMRGPRRAYDPHLAACAARPPSLSRLVWVGSTPPFTGRGQVGKCPRLSSDRSCRRPMGVYSPPPGGGLSGEFTPIQLRLGALLGVGLVPWGRSVREARVGLGRRLSAQHHTPVICSRYA